jgi:hypothetical protein
MTKKNQHKPITLDDLATMINQDFTETQRYIDKRLGGMGHRLDKVDERLTTMEGILKNAVQELNTTHEDVRYIRSTVNILVRNDTAQEAAIKTLSTGVARLEKKVVLAN